MDIILTIIFGIISTVFSVCFIRTSTQRACNKQRKRIEWLTYISLYIIVLLCAFGLHIMKWYITLFAPLCCAVVADLIAFLTAAPAKLEDVIGRGFLYNFVEKENPNAMMSETFDKLIASDLSSFVNTIKWESFVKILYTLTDGDYDRTKKIIESANSLVELFDVKTMYITTNSIAMTFVTLSITNKLKDVNLSGKQEFINAAINFVYYGLFVKYLTTVNSKPE